MAQPQIKAMVQGVYDIQKIRIQAGNRIIAAFKSRAGVLKNGQTGKDLPDEGAEVDRKRKEADDVLEIVRLAYSRIADGLLDRPVDRKRFEGNEIISSYAEAMLVKHYEQLRTTEEKCFKELGEALNDIPFYAGWLKNVKGVGPATAGVLFATIDIERAQYPSSLWKLAGLDVVITEDGQGQGRSRRSEHLVDYEYIDKDGNPAIRKGITFNPFLKTKLMGVLAPGFIKCGMAKSTYAQEYYHYKHRLQSRPDLKDHSKGHIHNMAMRYMMKRFLVDLHIAWRKHEGLPVADEYSIAKLHMTHRSAEKYQELPN